MQRLFGFCLLHRFGHLGGLFGGRLRRRLVGPAGQVAGLVSDADGLGDDPARRFDRHRPRVQQPSPAINLIADGCAFGGAGDRQRRPPVAGRGHLDLRRRGGRLNLARPHPLDQFVLRRAAEIARVLDPLVQPRSHPLEHVLVHGGLGEVVYLVGVGREVVKLLDGLGLAEEEFLHGVELALVVEASQFLHDGHLVAVGNRPGVGPLGHEVVDVLVLLVADSADVLVAADVHSLAGQDDEVRCGGLLLAEEIPALHVIGYLHADGAHGRRSEVGQHDEIVADAAGLDLARPADDERHPRAAVVEPPFAARHTPPMVGPEEHHGAVVQAVLFEPGQDLARLLVHRGDVVVAPRDGLPDDRRVRVIGGQGRLGRVVDQFLVLLGPVLGLVGDAQVDDGEERHAIGPVPPILARVPRRERAGELVIGLRVVGAEVPGRA